MNADLLSTAAASDAFESVPGDAASGLLLLADHASNRVPEPYGSLGLPATELGRHIGYDIGAEWVTRRLAALSGAPALLTRFSRLVIDPNRGEDDPTLVMRLSDGAIVPGNAGVDADERQRRIERFHRPYHQAVARTLDSLTAAGPAPVIVSVHSFTPVWKGVARPWEIAILWDSDDRLARPLIERFRTDGWMVGDNEPYDGALKGDSLYRHGTAAGRAHVLIELRQDLIGTEAAAAVWAERLWRAIAPELARSGLRERRFFGSRADR